MNITRGEQLQKEQTDKNNKTAAAIIDILSHEDVVEWWPGILEEVTAGMKERDEAAAEDARNYPDSRPAYSWEQ